MAQGDDEGVGLTVRVQADRDHLQTLEFGRGGGQGLDGWQEGVTQAFGG